jgi:hypothetical protein
MKKRVVITVSIVIGSIILIAGVFLYLLFYIGSKDLKVKYTEQDYISVKNKLKDASQSGDNDEPVILNITQEEITALINSEDMKDIGLKNTQVKLNDSGVMEVSTVVSKEFIVENILKDENAIPSFVVPQKASIYINTKVSVKNNKVELEPEKLQIGVFNVPDDFLKNDIVHNIEKSIENMLEGNEDLDIESLEIKEGGLVFNGIIPENFN